MSPRWRSRRLKIWCRRHRRSPIRVRESELWIGIDRGERLIRAVDVPGRTDRQWAQLCIAAVYLQQPGGAVGVIVEQLAIRSFSQIAREDDSSVIDVSAVIDPFLHG